MLKPLRLNNSLVKRNKTKEQKKSDKQKYVEERATPKNKHMIIEKCCNTALRMESFVPNPELITPRISSSSVAALGSDHLRWPSKGKKIFKHVSFNPLMLAINKFLK